MRIILLLLLTIVLAAPVASAQKSDSTRVTFILQSPGLPDSSKVYLTGSPAALGEWNPAKVAMEKTGDQTWSKTVYLEKTGSVQYKYTLGSWERQATHANGQALPNFTLKFSGDTTVRNEVQHWIAQQAWTITGGITGTVQYHRAIAGNGLQKRDLVVWLPPGYEKGNNRYPVLYLHDGQNIMDPATSSFGVDWRVDETADSLIRAGEINPMIIVGINNTSDRMDEYTPGEKGTAYMDLVVNTIKPLVDQHYRTKTGPKHTLTGGSSAGGIMAFMLAWEHPNVFSKAICMSPAFKVMHIDYVKDVLAYTGKKKVLFFYIDNGGIDLEEKLQPGIDEMLNALQQKGYREGKDYFWVRDPEAPHFESAWARRMPLALKLMQGKNSHKKNN
ncbi:histidine kinase [Pontibacter sp. HJ8]